MTPFLGCIFVGFLAMYVFPDLIEYTILPNIPAGKRDHVLLLIVAGMTIGLTRAAHEGKAFFLMGAFLTGLCFSTCHEVHHVWEHQVGRSAVVVRDASFSRRLPPPRAARTGARNGGAPKRGPPNRTCTFPPHAYGCGCSHPTSLPLTPPRCLLAGETDSVCPSPHILWCIDCV